MNYNDFIDFINERHGLDKTFADLENLITYGISWCEDGEDEDGNKTILCAQCKHYKECDAINDLFA